MSGSRKRKKVLHINRLKRAKLYGSMAGALVFLLIAVTVYGIWTHNIKAAHTVEPLTSEQVFQANMINADKLMIVAHPDDDTLWGGGHLASGNWLVVCITNGRNDTRRDEFNRTMNASGNAHIILEYPDKVNGSRDDWSEVREGISKDIGMLLSYKNWHTVVTHNPDGEYGHQHHKMTSAIVTQGCIDRGMTDRLEYFGKYYSAAKLPGVQDSLTRISDEELKFKEYLLTFYKSQKTTVNKLGHMNPFEEWQTFDEYYGNK